MNKKVGLTNWQLENLRQNNKTMYAALARPCEDCNISWHPLVMTFDHRDRATKKATIAELRVSDTRAFKQEMLKCDVVCRNCHQIREYLRDLGIIEISETKIERYRYYERLIPFLCGGAMLRRDAYELVPIGTI